MNIRYNDTPEKAAYRLKVLPDEDMVESILIPAILDKMKTTLIQMLKQEIEVYKLYPKAGPMDVKKFDPRNHKTCFQGQAHKVTNSHVTDANLPQYRKAVGTISHSVWGACTLLEIWGGDHYKDYPYMVTQVFKYCRGDIKRLPTLKFHVMPLFNNSKTGKLKRDESDKEVAKERYRKELNGELADYGRRPVKEIKGKWLEDFEKEWEIRFKSNGDF